MARHARCSHCRFARRLIRQVIPEREALNFGFTFLNIPKALMRMIRTGNHVGRCCPLLHLLGLESAALPSWKHQPRWSSPRPSLELATRSGLIATLMSVASPLKIWNNTRIEMNLERTRAPLRAGWTLSPAD